jgi:hypothetical protein
MPALEPSKEDSQKYKMSVSIPESKFAVNFCRKEAEFTEKQPFCMERQKGCFSSLQHSLLLIFCN